MEQDINPEIAARHRSSRRLRHEAEVQVFKSKTGSLEDIRASLGLRPSQICEILKVHPSAWTRWVRQGDAPPHIYQMLEWYMELLSWRGQNNPVFLQKKMRRETPDTYLPEKEPFAAVLKERTSRKKFLEVRAFTTFLIFSFMVQIVVWVSFYFLLRSH